jgi:hypothetical protein
MYFARNGYLTGARVWVRNADRISPLNHHVLHSPNGHAWGYRGSGPSEPAKDILWDLLGKGPATVLYQAFMEGFLVGLNRHDGFAIEDLEIRRWLAAREQAS